MADKFINSTGLLAIKTWIEGKFALDSDLDTLSDKVDDIIAEGGEPNVIETVKVNGTALVPVAKAVDVIVPTKTSDLTNDGDGTTPFATTAVATTSANGLMSSTDKTKLDGVEAGAEENTIETVKVNGSALTPDANKAVDVTVPTSLTDLANDGSTSATKYATEAYVDTNGGKIDVIKVNGTTQTITNKTVDITVPTQVSDLTNDSGFQTSTQVSTAITTALANGNDPYQTESDVESAISTAVTAVYKYKGSVATVADLPASGNTTGDVYDVQATGVNYAWNGSAWDALGQYVDTTAFWTNVTGQTNTLEALTVAEINAILEPTP